MKIAIRIPGTRLAIGRHDGRLRRASRGARDVRRSFAVLGQDLWTLVVDGPGSRLNQTVNTQPVMLTAGVAVWRAWLAAGGRDAGRRRRPQPGRIHRARRRRARSHFADALPLVRFRAQAMQEAVPAGVGAMAAILGLDAAGRRGRLPRREPTQAQVVEPVNFNAPEQIVIAGHKEAVERAIDARQRARARSAACCCRCPRRSTARC